MATRATDGERRIDKLHNATCFECLGQEIKREGALALDESVRKRTADPMPCLRFEPEILAGCVDL